MVGIVAVSAGPLARPATAADQSQTTTHSLGGKPTPGLTTGISATAARLAQGTTLPASVDLSAWDAPVGNQGSVGSCTSWATGYYYRYWLRNHGLGEFDTFAPMYLYSQIVHGVNTGTTFLDNLNILESQGIPHGLDYAPSDYDYTTQPTPDEVTAAAPFKTTSHSLLFAGTGSNRQAVVQASLAAGAPVLLMIPVYANFDSASWSHPLVGVPSPGMASRGYHAVFVPKYDADGVWIENSWGTSWGQGGWAELSWAFMNQYAIEGWSMASGNDTWSVTLGTSATSVLGGTSVTLNAAANHDVGPTPYYLVILRGDGSVVRYCANGTTCSAAETGDVGSSQTYKAVVGTATGESPQTTSPPVTVRWTGPLSKLVVSGMTTPRMAGSAGSIRVTATDAYGNRVSSYGGKVHFTSSDPQAKLPADYTFVAEDSGTHVFAGTVILKTVGTLSVTAADKATATIKGAQSGIVVTAASVKALVVSGMTTPRMAGSAGSIRVTATDAYGNRIAGYRGTVHFTSSDVAASLPRNYTFTAADNGTHVFVASVILRTAGNQWARATDQATATITGVLPGIVVSGF